MLIHPSHNLSKCQAILSNDGFNFIMNLIALHALTSNTITNIFIYYSVFSENSQGEQTENVPEGNPKRHWNSLNLNEFQCLFCLIKSPLIRTIVVSVTMYYSHPFRLAKSSIAAQNRSHRANVICDGSPSRIRRGTADLLWDDDPPEVVNASDDAGCFHILLLHFMRSKSHCYCLQTMGNYANRGQQSGRQFANCTL